MPGSPPQAERDLGPALTASGLSSDTNILNDISASVRLHSTAASFQETDLTKIPKRSPTNVFAESALAVEICSSGISR